MKASNLYIVSFMYFVLLGVLLNGQEINLDVKNEKVIFFTDRTLYITSEQIYFSAFVKSAASKGFKIESKVLYLELISSNGDKIIGNKYEINDSVSFSSLYIPNDILSGNYIIKAYTKFMRNFGPETYSYCVIKIINPFKNEVIPKKDYGNIKNLEVPKAHSIVTNGINLSTDKFEYAKRSIVKIQLSINDSLKKNLRNLCLSVTPEGSIGQLNSSLLGESKNFSSLYLPEVSGITVSGKMIDKLTSQPLKDKLVNLSIIGDGKDFIAIRTDSFGRFFFSLPDLNGNNDIFLCSQNISGAIPVLFIDNDFCSIPVHLSTENFKLSDEERFLALKMATNQQITKNFQPDSALKGDKKNRISKAFYGTPSQIIWLDKYIQLSNLEEYFTEIPSHIRVQKQHGKKYFRLYGTQMEMEIYDPLVLFDFVAIDDPDRILAVSPTGISRIEIVNVPYIKGNIIYGGILSIISKNADFAGIDLPSSGIFINYMFYNEKGIALFQNIPSPNFPDSRNTLLWIPKLDFNINNSSEISFRTADMTAQYKILVRGIDSNGNVVVKTIDIEVK